MYSMAVDRHLDVDTNNYNQIAPLFTSELDESPFVLTA